MKTRLGPAEFAKYHALGNDYLIVDLARFGVALSRARIRAICARHTGIGADGILAVSASRRGDFSVRIFNPDGSEAEKSGNGIRILARFLYEFGYTPKTTLAIETKGGVVRARVQCTGDRIDAIRVAMGRASFLSTDIPVRGPVRDVLREPLQIGGRTFRVTCVSIGNPHCVIFVRSLRSEELRRFGPLLERHPRFPNRINVQFACVRSRRRIDALIWERGAGETLASGSSSCAVAAAAVRHGLVGGDVRVCMPGGSLAIRVGEGFQIEMTGPATPVCRGRLGAG